MLKKRQFRWKNGIADNLISILEKFKALTEFKGKYFDDDRQAKYTVLWKELCKKYEDLGTEEVIKR